jgi:hypothetical protein
MTTPPSSPSPWRLQLSLRTLLVGIFVLGVCFGWMADHLHQGRVMERQFQTIHTLQNERVKKLEEDLQAIKQGNPGTPLSPELTWVVRRGAAVRTSPTSAVLAWPEASDDELGAIARASTLTNLSLADGRFTPTGIAELRQLPQLKALSLQGAWCDGECLAQLAALHDLTSLRIGEARFDDAALATIGKMAALRELSICRTPISDFALFHLSWLERLEFLSLDETDIGDEGLAYLKDLRKLRSLSLRKTKVTDAGLHHLQSLDELSDIGLRETGITDAGLLQLAPMKNLRQVNVMGTNVTEGGAVEFRKRAPKCRVTFANGRRM